VCLNATNSGNAWTCATCHKQCHMLCIFQWTLRLSLNERRHFSGFTCPGCRSRHSIATLPGFEQQAEPSRPRTRTRNTNTPADALRRAFGLTSNASRRTDDDSGEGSSADGRGLEMVVEEDDEDDESDEDDDDFEDEPAGRWVFRISAERIYFEVNTLNIHSR
jgi:hypothetical protein